MPVAPAPLLNHTYYYKMKMIAIWMLIKSNIHYNNCLNAVITRFYDNLITR